MCEKNIERDKDIYKKLLENYKARDLSKEYNISTSRIYQIFYEQKNKIVYGAYYKYNSKINVVSTIEVDDAHCCQMATHFCKCEYLSYSKDDEIYDIIYCELFRKFLKEENKKIFRCDKCLNAPPIYETNDN